MTFSRLFFLPLLLAALTQPAQAAQCPDYGITSQLPAAPVVSKKSFKKWTNSWLSAWYKPYHMVHDVIVGDGQSATITGKFDYDAVLHKDLEGEYVHAYLSGSGMDNWEYLGRFTTDTDGKIFVPTGVRAVGDYQIRMVVEGDLSSVTGYLTVADSSRETILFDIDGTLTLNDFEAVGDYPGPVHTKESDLLRASFSQNKERGVILVG